MSDEASNIALAVENIANTAAVDQLHPDFPRSQMTFAQRDLDVSTLVVGTPPCVPVVNPPTAVPAHQYDQTPSQIVVAASVPEQFAKRE
jgi:hypothetical protein